MATRAEQSCFDNGIVLTVHETGLTRYDINGKNEWDYFFRLDMPRDVTCTQCILQWKYNAGLSFVRVGWLVVLRFNVPVNNFSVMSGRSHRFLGN